MSSIEDAIEAAGFGAFAEALRESPYGEVIDSGGDYTVFAPTNAAFEKFPAASLEHLLHGDEALLRNVLGYHFASGRVRSASFRGKRIRASMYAGGHLIIDGRNGLRVDRANLTQPDVIAGACVVHGIDAVLWPQTHAMAVSK
jgi:uncharacterized surface protein with fasciclin (FAS1) repeats